MRKTKRKRELLEKEQEQLKETEYNPSEPVTGLTEVIDRFKELKKSFNSIVTPSGKRMFVITFGCEAAYIEQRLREMLLTWKMEYPLFIDRDKLIEYLALFDEYSDTMINYSLYSYFSNSEDEEFVKLIDVDNPVFKDFEPKEDEIEELKKTDKYNDLPFDAEDIKIIDFDKRSFENLFTPDVICEVFSLRPFEMDEKIAIRECRKTLKNISDYDMAEIVKFGFLCIKWLLEGIKNIIDEPALKTRTNIYSDAFHIYGKACADRETQLGIWKRFNLSKNDYSERIKHRKDELRKQIKENEWDSEWQDLFKYEDNFVEPDKTAIGAFIHYHLKKMQADNHKQLLVFIGLVEDWLFYTLEEFELLEKKESKAVRDDLNYLVPKKEEEDVEAREAQIIIVKGDYVNGKTVQTQIDNINDGGIGITTKQIKNDRRRKKGLPE